MNLTGVIWRNRAIVSVICLFGFFSLAGAQPAGNTVPAGQPAAGTPEMPAANTTTNAANEQEVSTNALGIQPPAAPAYGAQPVPNDFEAQNNAPARAGPSFVGGGQAISPVTGTGIIGVPGFAPMTGPGIYQAGLLNLHAGLSYSFIYGTGIEELPGQHTATVEQIVTPTASLNIGTHLTIDYAPNVSIYTGNSELRNVTGQSADLRWSSFYEGWAFGLSQGYSYSSTPLIETGTQTTEYNYVTGANISRQLGGAFTATLGLNQSFRDASQFNNLDEWSASLTVNYMLSPKLQVGLNVGGGYDEISDSPSMSDESYSLIMMARPGVKTTIDLSVGVEQEKFQAGGIPSSTVPIFSASINYQVLSKTSIGVSAQRSVSPSFFSNQVSTATSASVVLHQGLSSKLNLSITGTYGNSSYQSIEPGPLPQNFLGVPTVSLLEVTRNDDTSSIGASLGYAFRPRLTGALSYSYGWNTSSQGDFNYTSSQIMVQLSYQY